MRQKVPAGQRCGFGHLLLASAFLFLSAVPVLCTTLSISPGTVPAKGTLKVTYQNNSAGTIFAQVKLNGKIIKVLHLKGSSPITSFELDTTGYKDGGYFLILETIDNQAKQTRKPYFLLIGNNTENAKEKEPYPPGKVSHLFPSLHQGEGQQDEGEIKQILLTAERLYNDVEADTLVPFKYNTNRDHLQFLSDTEGYPVPAVPFTASRVLGLLAERQGLYSVAEEYYSRNLINHPTLYDTRIAEEHIRLLRGVEDPGKAISSARRLKHTLERQKGNEKDVRTKYLIAVLEKYAGNTTRAEQLFKEIVDNSQSANPPLPLGERDGVRGEVTDSRPTIQQWLRYQLAVLDKEKGEYGKAIETFKKLLTESKERIDDYARFQLGETYFLKRDFRQALPYYEKIALTHSPTEDRPFALYQTGVCCMELNKPEKAREYLVILNKDYPQHRLTRQGMYLYADASYLASRNKRWGNDPAVELETITSTLRQVIERYPNTKEAEDSYYLISQSIREVTDELNKRGQYSAAKRVYAKLVGEEAVGLNTKEGDKTNTDTEIQLQEKETNPIIRNYLQLADKLYVNRKYAEAIKMYQRILQESPRSSLAPWVQRTIGICYADLGNHEKAIEELLKGVRKYPNSQYAPQSLERVIVYYKGVLNDYEQAVKYGNEFLEKYQDNKLTPNVLYVLGLIHMEKEELSQAREYFQKITKVYPQETIAMWAKERTEEIAVKEKGRKTR